MSSKKEEERNEKIIRGLMKLPPNRRCINCNSVGPQYVCTTFWTFVCLSCSGIHREFTHRVKSVSMAKFTRQEVEALQEGGNQRAREIYLKNWDMTRMRLPDSSNPERIRDFIRSVYVNKKYAGERSSENTPKDAENLKANESELKRPNSYHSFSQSPPYDYQYEERRYGKNSALAPRRLGSERGYEGKVPSFLVSPGRLRDHAMFEDRFANESSGSRLSDFSVSSAGEQFRYDTQSPNSQGGYSSPNAAYQSNRHPNARPQRTSSSGSFGSFDSNSVPESTSEQPVQLTSGSQQLVTSPSSQRPPLGSNQFGFRPALVRPAAPVNQPPAQQTATSTPSDTSIDLFAGFNERNMAGLNRTLSAEPAVVGPTASFNVPPAQQSAATTPSDTSIDLFSGFNEQNTAGLYRTVSAGPTVMAPTRPASRPATSFIQQPTQQPAASSPSDSSVDLFANFNEHNATGVGTVSSGQSVTSPTGPASTGPATSFNQLPTQQLAASTPDTSLDLFAAFNENNTAGFNGTVSAGQAVTSPTDVGVFAGFNNQPPMEVKDVGWANFDFSQQKFAHPTSILSSPVVTSSEKDFTTGMHPMTGQVPVSSASALPQDPLTIAKAPPVNQERSQPWNAFGESSSSSMYGANTQVQMPSPQLSMPGLPQVAPGHSAHFDSLAPVGSNEVAKLNTPPAVQLSVQKPMAPLPAQPQLGNQWFANAFDVSNMLPYQGVSQDLVKSDTHSVPVLSSLTGAPSLTQPNLAALQPLQSSSPYDLYAGHVISKELESANPDHASEPTSVMGAMSAPHQPLQGMPYQAMQSTNPFDFLDDSDLPNNTFMDMSSIQTSLPTQSPAADLYSRGGFQSEFYPQNLTSTDASHMPQGDIQQMRYQVPNPQIQNPTPQGCSSLGSNPFA